jgi:hypothetical protein
VKKTVMTALIAAFGLLASQAFAADGDCVAQATEKKLAGAAKNSFLKKCERDAKGAAPAAAAASPACEKSAADKKLAGAAKKSHLKKCMADEAAKK